MDLLSRFVTLCSDQSPRAAATVKYFLAILDGEAVIPGGIKLLMADLDCDGFVHHLIDDAHFPGADPFVSTEGVRPVEIDLDVWADKQATPLLAAMGLQPVRPDKGIKWAAENPDAQRSNQLVISGQRSHVGAQLIVLDESDGLREADLCSVHKMFARGARILAEPKTVAAGT